MEAADVSWERRSAWRCGVAHRLRHSSTHDNHCAVPPKYTPPQDGALLVLRLVSRLLLWLTMPLASSTTLELACCWEPESPRPQPMLLLLVVVVG